MDRGDLEMAARLFGESSKLAPHFKTFELLGECLIRLNRNAEAVAPLAAAVGLGTKPFRSLYLLAQALHGIGVNDWALGKLDEALDLNPNYNAARELRETISALHPLQKSDD